MDHSFFTFEGDSGIVVMQERPYSQAVPGVFGVKYGICSYLSNGSGRSGAYLDGPVRDGANMVVVDRC